LKRFTFLILVCFAALQAEAQQNIPYVILISFDGFRHDYVERFNAPTFKSFIAKGSKAETLIPSFPSKTFPNHYTLVTGLYPGNHGLVDNSFYDRQRNVVYGMGDKSKVEDGYYYGGIPIWELAKKNGVKSASFFWVGSEMSDKTRRPDYYFPYTESVSSQQRIDQVLAWLALPESERPHFISLYFSFPDDEGHKFGPEAIETKNAVLRADSLLSQLTQRVEATRLPVNIIIVSDHGMQEVIVKEETTIFIDELIDRKNNLLKLVNNGTHTHLYISNEQARDSVYAVLKKTEVKYSIYKKEELPARWNYKHDRVGDLLLVAKPGNYARTTTHLKFLKNTKLGNTVGEHGYDPMLTKNVHGIFYAQGPNIKPGITLPSFQNIHVYPLMAKILGLPLPAIDGKEEVLIGIYKK
jgi:alkaline phosphatase D